MHSLGFHIRDITRSKPQRAEPLRSVSPEIDRSQMSEMEQIEYERKKLESHYNELRRQLKSLLSTYRISKKRFVRNHEKIQKCPKTCGTQPPRRFHCPKTCGTQPPQRFQCPKTCGAQPPQWFHCPKTCDTQPPQRFHCPQTCDTQPPQRFHCPKKCDTQPPQRFHCPKTCDTQPPQRFHCPKTCGTLPIRDSTAIARHAH
ncbi:unnamed protein product [Nesidiocoris tenuis]|uniref:Uncharacterized protein n=1 Tax=Nesidiocoris tenuis TaxID=355587 RepID=A0A6H5FZ89_9HEMI|nr:unnamed protein product [Nesidiocoris tenuis]